jgi:hypothetical protein
MELGEKMDKSHAKELKEMIQENKSKEPLEKVISMFCTRHGLSMDTCRKYYSEMLAKGEIKEK